MSAEIANPGKRVICFDCYSGVSGDMALGALLDCGASIEDLERLLHTLKLPGWRLQTSKVVRHGLSGTAVSVETDQPGPNNRGLNEITGIIYESKLPRPVKEMSAAIFKNLAEAEAAVHGTAVEQVHFHEVGAVDSIIDIVGTATAFYLLKLDQVCCSALPLGRGTVQTAHGLIPLPGPAVLEMLKGRHIPVYGVDAAWEMVTPTGVAIMTTLTNHFGPPPLMNIEAVGYGAGKFDPGYPNYLRVFIGTAVSSLSPHEEKVMQIEANIDDLNPEIFGYLIDKLLQAGALDVYFTPVQMKKNRPAVKLSVLAAHHNLNILLEKIFQETSTLGVRIFEGNKRIRPRSVETVQTGWGPVRVKVVPAESGKEPLHFSPEYEDCRAIAARSGLPLKDIYRAVEYAYLRQLWG